MKKLRIYYQNTRGLNTKIKTGFRNRSILFNFDIYAITESWLQENIASSELFNELYTVRRADRSLSDTVRSGGGVIVAIKNKWF